MWTIVLTTALAAGIPWFRHPAISPDGKTVAFSYAGDIYLAPAEGGEARLLVSHPAYDSRPRFSPDGVRLAFTSDRTGAGDVYVFEIATGALARLTHHESPEWADAWSPDGAWVYFSSGRAGLVETSDVWRVPARGGTPAPVAADPYEHEYAASVARDGRVALNTGDSFRQWWRAGPRRADATEIWIAPSTRVTRYAGKDSWPLFRPDGTLAFVSDEGGAENLWTCAADGSGRRRLTDFEDGRVLWPQVAANEGSIVFERDFRIWRFDPVKGTAAPIPLRAVADESRNPVAWRTYTGDVEEFELSPDGMKIAWIVHGEVFAAATAAGGREGGAGEGGASSPAGGGSARRVTRTAARERGLAWAADSARLLYASDREGDPDLYIYDFRSSEEKRLTADPRAELFPAVSPDGRRAAYVVGSEEIRLLDLETGESRPFVKIRGTDVEPADERPAWSPDGRTLAFLDADERLYKNVHLAPLDAPDRRRQVTFLANVGGACISWLPDGGSLVFTTGHHRLDGRVVRVTLERRRPALPEDRFDALFSPPAPGTVETAREGERGTDGRKGPAGDASDVRDRLERLVPFAPNVWQAAVSRDGETFVYVCGAAGRDDIYAVSLAPGRGDRATRLTDLPSGADNLRFDPDGKTLWFRSDGLIRSVPLAGGPVRTFQATATLDVDFHAEKMQVFREAWRLIRDHFYDAKLGGLDWEAARRRYEPLAAGARDPIDLHDAIALLLGELDASHLGSHFPRRPAEVASGDLGIDLEPGTLRVRGLVPGGPAALAAGAIVPGDEILAIDGRPAAPPESLDALLLGTAGRRVRVAVASASAGGERRTIDLVAATPAEVRALRYRAWVRANEASVARASGGRLGYVHLRDMDRGSLERFEIDLDTQARGREGVVLDVRWNRGGWVAPFVLDALERRTARALSFSLRDRGGGPAWDLAGRRTLDLPTILVQNGASLSNAEMFAEAYRRLGLGKVVGTPSAGWVIWTSDWALLDGARFKVPRIGIRTAEGQDLDEAARPPDVVIERAVGHVGEDPQLAAAVAELLKELDER